MPLSSLPRLADMLLDHSGWLDCELRGFQEQDDGGVRHGLQLSVTGSLVMKCQRCLEQVTIPCVIDARLWLVPPGAVSAGDEADLVEGELDEFDAIPATRDMSVRELFEDEILLALPLVPRHGECSLPVDTADGAAGQDRSPFAALAGLKKQ
jgi:uncharacterized protein